MLNIYADLNCPFCFGQYQRLLASGAHSRFSWRYIEHAPSLNSAGMTPEQRELLDYEVGLIQQRAPDVLVRHPGFCINTRRPILSLLHVEACAPDRARDYCTSLYRAYWQEGQDISDPLVIQELLAALGIEQPDILPQVEEVQQQWQRKWELGNFEKRIPAIEADDGRVMLGLQHSYNIENFLVNLQSGTENAVGAVCDRQRQLTVALLGLPDLHGRLSGVSGGYQFEQFDDVQQFDASPGFGKVDAVLLAFEPDRESNYMGIRAIKEGRVNARDIPLVYLAREPDDQGESQAFALGATDFVVYSGQVSPLLARIKAGIQVFQTISLLYEYASIDALTGMINKREFQRALEKEWRRSCRSGDSLALLVIDIDHFKRYNDYYGHSAGDDCLRTVARSLMDNTLRPSDICCRFGGEEFVILMPETTMEGAQAVAERMRGAIEALAIPHLGVGETSHVTASFGVCCARPHADQTPLEFFELADRALYESKESGRNRVTQSAMERPHYAL